MLDISEEIPQCCLWNNSTVHLTLVVLPIAGGGGGGELLVIFVRSFNIFCFSNSNSICRQNESVVIHKVIDESCFFLRKYEFAVSTWQIYNYFNLCVVFETDLAYLYWWMRKWETTKTRPYCLLPSFLPLFFFLLINENGFCRGVVFSFSGFSWNTLLLQPWVSMRGSFVITVMRLLWGLASSAGKGT